MLDEETGKDISDGPTYKDKEGKVLFGFSSTDLKENTKWMRYLLVVYGGVIIFLVAYVVWLTQRLM
jgi:hypothetical protein|tara:strand:+ start:4151 stop:4348 length:198 start_codon:yes stop_codon:yes gene_type:complete